MNDTKTSSTTTLEQEHLKLPQRGDIVARRWANGGVAIYLVLATVFLATQLATEATVGGGLLNIIGLGNYKNYTVTILVLASITLTFASMADVFRDIRLMRPEESDIEWVDRNKRPWLMLVFAKETEREALFKQGINTLPLNYKVNVESLVDDRVRRTNAVLSGSETGGVSAEEFRLIAEKRTASLGSFARYSSSLLLLLAVLGTFAGVKTALPGLIKAVTMNTSVDAGLASGPAVSAVTGIAEPLGAVADAFGGNALALIGAIALGIMSQGLTVGRRHFLERLELVSSQHIYRGQDLSAANPLEGAVRSLKETAVEIIRSNGALVGINIGLEALGRTFRDSLTSLEGRLASIAERNESDMFDKVKQSLSEVNRRVGDLGDVVAANAGIYSGLVEQIGSRAAETRSALQEMQAVNKTLNLALSKLGGVGVDATSAVAKVGEAALALQHSTGETKEQLSALTKAVATIGPDVKSVHTSFEDSLKRIERVDQQASETWKSVGADVSKLLSDRLGKVDRQSIEVLQNIGAEIAKVLTSMTAVKNTAGQRLSVAVQSSSEDSSEVAGLLREVIKELRELPRADESTVSPLKATIAIIAALAIGGVIPILFTQMR